MCQLLLLTFWTTMHGGMLSIADIVLQWIWHDSPHWLHNYDGDDGGGGGSNGCSSDDDGSGDSDDYDYDAFVCIVWLEPLCWNINSLVSHCCRVMLYVLPRNDSCCCSLFSGRTVTRKWWCSSVRVWKWSISMNYSTTLTFQSLAYM